MFNPDVVKGLQPKDDGTLDNGIVSILRVEKDRRIGRGSIPWLTVLLSSNVAQDRAAQDWAAGHRRWHSGTTRFLGFVLSCGIVKQKTACQIITGIPQSI